MRRIVHAHCDCQVFRLEMQDGKRQGGSTKNRNMLTTSLLCKLPKPFQPAVSKQRLIGKHFLYGHVAQTNRLPADHGIALCPQSLRQVEGNLTLVVELCVADGVTHAKS